MTPSNYSQIPKDFHHRSTQSQYTFYKTRENKLKTYCMCYSIGPMFNWCWSVCFRPISRFIFPSERKEHYCAIIEKSTVGQLDVWK